MKFSVHPLCIISSLNLTFLEVYALNHCLSVSSNLQRDFHRQINSFQYPSTRSNLPSPDFYPTLPIFGEFPKLCSSIFISSRDSWTLSDLGCTQSSFDQDFPSRICKARNSFLSDLQTRLALSSFPRLS